MIDLQREGDVFVLQMNNGENRMNPDFVAALTAALDEVEGHEGPAALVTTGQGKFYSNGLDLDWLMKQTQEVAGPFLNGLLKQFGRILSFPAVTVAAMNGHAFAGGGMLALAHDRLVMRSDRGYFCLPEADLGLPLHPGMNALITARLSKFTAHEAIVTGRRYSAADAMERRIVHEAVPEAEVLPRAIAVAAEHTGKNRANQRALKQGIYAEALPVLGIPVEG